MTSWSYDEKIKEKAAEKFEIYVKKKIYTFLHHSVSQRRKKKEVLAKAEICRWLQKCQAKGKIKFETPKNKWF